MPDESYLYSVAPGQWVAGLGWSWRYPASSIWSMGVAETGDGPTESTAPGGHLVLTRTPAAVEQPALPWDAPTRPTSPPPPAPPGHGDNEEGGGGVGPEDIRRAIEWGDASTSWSMGAVFLAGFALLMASSRPGYIYLAASAVGLVMTFVAKDRLDRARQESSRWDTDGPAPFGLPSCYAARKRAERALGAALAVAAVALLKFISSRDL